MSQTNNAELIKKYFEEVWNYGNLDVLDEILDENYVNHSPGAPNPPAGPAGLKPIVTAIREAFPDLKYIIENIVISENQIAVHIIMTGTHLGDFFGIAPTGKQIRVNQMQIEHIRNNKIIEHWRVTDDLNLMRQLGQIIP